MSRKNSKRIRAEAAKAELQRSEPIYKVNAGSLQSKTEFILPRTLAKAPKVWYSNRAWQKMQKAISMCTEEVGWLGNVDEINGGYMVTDIHVPEQTVTGTETDISADALAQLVVDLDYPKNLYYWGHSHVNMGVSPSGQDEQQTAEYLEHNDVFIRGIYNKKGASKVDVFDVKNGIQYLVVDNGARLENLPEDEMNEFIGILNKNVKKRSYAKPIHQPYQHNKPMQSTGGKPIRQDPFRYKDSRSNGGGAVSMMYENPFIVKED